MALPLQAYPVLAERARWEDARARPEEGTE